MNRFVLALLPLILPALPPSTAHAEAACLHVSYTAGDDTNPGTPNSPLKSLREAAARLEKMEGNDAVTIVLAPGIHPVEGTIAFETRRRFTEDQRLVIEATVLPDDPSWDQGQMPILFSVEKPTSAMGPSGATETYCLDVDVDHATIRGLKFLGNPHANNYHCAIERVSERHDDLLVSQCVFAGAPGGFDIYCPVIATGDGLAVEHCVFHGCHNGVVFWDGPEAVGSSRNAVRNSIFSGCSVSAVWTCQTNQDLTFENNIITDCQYAWMRKPGDTQTYSLSNSALARVDHLSGSGGAFGPFQPTGEDVVFKKDRVNEPGEITLETRRAQRNYLHVVPGTPGSDLNAGLFTGDVH